MRHLNPANAPSSGVLLFWFVLVGWPGFAFGQAASDVSHTRATWYGYFGTHGLTGKTSLHLEGQWRRVDWIREKQQLLLRPALNYHLNSSVILTGGYGCIETPTFAPDGERTEFPEHRIFQQLIVNHGRKVQWQHRLRQEQRYLADQPFRRPGSGDRWRFQHRFRYLVRSAIPLTKKRFGGTQLIFYNELFLRGRTSPETVIDRNRAYAALGFPFKGFARAEVGYLHHLVLFTPQRRQHDHTAMLMLYVNTPGRR